jgi:hypothetical protein
MTDKEKEKHIKWLDKMIAKCKAIRKQYSKSKDRTQWCLIRGKELAHIEMKKRIKNS